jgi:DNA-binding NarL/FixJ family response regulator
LKILVVDDHALVREGLRQVLRGLDENVEVLEAPHCARAFALAAAHADLDLVLLDYHLPDMDGLSALDVLRDRHPELPVFILSGSANPQIMGQVLAKGAAGFMTKSSMSEELLVALRLVLNGDIYVPVELQSARSLASSSSNAATSSTTADTSIRAQQAPQFTSRQLAVLQQLMDGRSNRQISQSLSMSEETVKTHVSSILRGFDVHTRMQAVLAAGRYGYRSNQPV